VSGAKPDDFEIRTFAGALIGVALAIAESPGHDYLQQFGPRLGAPRGRTAYLIAEDVAVGGAKITRVTTAAGPHAFRFLADSS
jgi:hypothetical protein